MVPSGAVRTNDATLASRSEALVVSGEAGSGLLATAEAIFTAYVAFATLVRFILFLLMRVT